jgi:hypothetical protein
MPIKDTIQAVLNDINIPDLQDYLGDGMYIIIKITSDEDGEIQVKELDGGRAGLADD